MNREEFINYGMMGFSASCVLPAASMSSSRKESKTIPLVMIEEFVKAGHNDLKKVKAMLKKEPNLIYARHDWGNGDFEEAIEGAGHVGDKEIATYLIEQGARINLFVLTMLGKTSLVKPALETYPHLIFAKGPHGFSLLHHAKVGGEGSKELYQYLSEKGLNETQFDI